MNKLQRTLYNFRIYKRHASRRANLDKGTQVDLGTRLANGQLEINIKSGPFEGYKFQISFRERHLYIGR